MVENTKKKFKGDFLLPDLKMKRDFLPIYIAIAYVMLNKVLGGLEVKHVILASLSILWIYNSGTKTFLKYFFPFVMTGAVYDFMRYFYWQGIEGHIHVAEPYFWEKKFFGVTVAGQRFTLNEYFAIHTSKVLDFFCGFAYLTFVAEYLFPAFYLFYKKKFKLIQVMGWAFLLVNVMGFSTYFIYPAAPPWYVTKYGLGPAIMYLKASPSAASRFDLLFGTHFFDAMYSQSVDLYGAFPSLHVAYPLLTAWVAFQLKKMRIPAILFYCLMCFSAIYLQHHYVIDILMGTGYALVAIKVVKRFVVGKEKGAWI